MSDKIAQPDFPIRRHTVRPPADRSASLGISAYGQPPAPTPVPPANDVAETPIEKKAALQMIEDAGASTKSFLKQLYAGQIAGAESYNPHLKDKEGNPSCWKIPPSAVQVFIHQESSNA